MATPRQAAAAAAAVAAAAKDSGSRKPSPSSTSAAARSIERDQPHKRKKVGDRTLSVFCGSGSTWLG